MASEIKSVRIPLQKRIWINTKHFWSIWLNCNQASLERTWDNVWYHNVFVLWFDWSMVYLSLWMFEFLMCCQFSLLPLTVGKVSVISPGWNFFNQVDWQQHVELFVLEWVVERKNEEMYNLINCVDKYRYMCRVD